MAKRKIEYILDPTRYLPGFYVVDMRCNDAHRGPYRYAETAVAIRTEMERSASDKMNERWNLGIIEVTPPIGKPEADHAT